MADTEKAASTTSGSNSSNKVATLETRPFSTISVPPISMNIMPGAPSARINVGAFTSDFKELQPFVEYVVQYQSTAPPERLEYNVQDCIESFTGRNEILDNLHATIQENKSEGRLTILSQTKIITGMGGVGKTETIRKYILIYKHLYQHILWISAENYTTARSDFFKVAEIIGVSIKDFERKLKPDKKIAEDIYDILCQKSCIVIFDNAEPAEESSPDNVLKTFSPPTVKGNWMNPTIIITTRHRFWKQVTLIELGGLTRDESFQLLKSQLLLEDSDENRELAIEIAKLSEGLPLVIQQIIGVIRDRNENPRTFSNDGQAFGIREFLSEVQESNGRNFIREAPADSNVGASVFNIFQVTFDHLSNRGENGLLALRCLDIMAFLNPDNIPFSLMEYLFRKIDEDIEEKKNSQNSSSKESEQRFGIIKLAPKGEGSAKSSRKNSDGSTKSSSNISIASKQSEQLAKFMNALNLLHKLNLVTRCKGHFSIHRMIQQIRLEFQNSNDIQDQQQLYTQILHSFTYFVQKLKINDSAIHEILDNGLHLLKRSLENCMNETYYQFLEILADKLHQVGKNQDAVRCYEELIEHYDMTLGPTEVSTLTTKSLLAKCLCDQGEFQKSLELFRVILSHRQALGRFHPHTLDTKFNIAGVLLNLSKYDEARDMYHEVLEFQKECLGLENPKTLTIRHNLAVILEQQGEFKVALEIFQQVLESRSKILGPEHADTLWSKYYLALLLNRNGDYTPSEKLYLEVINDFEKVQGPLHPHTLWTKHSLACVLINLGKHSAARKIYEEVLESREKIIGRNHPDTLRTRQSLALVLSRQGHYQLAQELYEDVLKNRIKIFGHTHPTTLWTKLTLALVLDKQGRFDDARNLNEEILAVSESTLGSNHPETLGSKHNLAGVLVNQGKYHEAKVLYEQVLAVRRELIGETHLFTTRTKHNLGIVHVHLGNYADAQNLYQDVLNARIQQFGDDHPDSLTIRQSRAGLLGKQGKLQEAKETLESVIKTQGRVLGEKHPDTFSSMHDLVEVLIRLMNFIEAKRMCLHVLNSRQEVLGAKHPDTLKSVHTFGIFLEKEGRLDDVKKHYEDLLADRTAVLGPNHPDVASTKFSLAEVLKALGRNREASEIYKNVLEIQIGVFGNDHLVVKLTKSRIL